MDPKTEITLSELQNLLSKHGIDYRVNKYYSVNTWVKVGICNTKLLTKFGDKSVTTFELLDKFRERLGGGDCNSKHPQVLAALDKILNGDDDVPEA